MTPGTDAAARRRTVVRMTTTRDPDGAVVRYVAALRATSEMEAPYGAVLFVLLTTMLRLHELLCPTTAVHAGLLTVESASASRGGSRGRTVPLPQVTVSLLGGRSGPLSACLGLQPAVLPRFGPCLRAALTDHEDLAGLTTPEQALSLALDALSAAAVTGEAHAAVLSYAGLAGGSGSGSGSPSQSQGLLVVDLLDTLAARAGFVASPPAHDCLTLTAAWSADGGA